MYRYPWIEKEGSLDIGMSNRSGRKFCDWTFRPVKGKNIKIQVDLMYPYKDHPLRFRAHSNHLTEAKENTDIELLRQEVEADLQKTAYLRSNIEWEEWFEVTVSGYVSDNVKDRSAALKIEYGKLKRGIDPETGEPVTIHNNQVVVPFPKPKKAGETRDSLGYHAADDAEVSYIPATPENEVALAALVERLRKLRRDVSALLSQDNIATVLLNVDSKLLLKE